MRGCGYIHIDDGCTVSTGPNGETFQDRWVAELRNMGFILTERIGSEVLRYLGYEPSESDARFLPLRDKLVAFSRCYDMFPRQRDVEVDLLGSVLGYDLFFCLLGRSAMGVWKDVFRFVRTLEHSRSPLWPGVRWELRVARGRLPLIAAELGAKTLPYVWGSDACGAAEDGKHWGGMVAGFLVGTEDEITAVLPRTETRGNCIGLVGRAGEERLPWVNGMRMIPRTCAPEAWDVDTGRWLAVLERALSVPEHVKISETRASSAAVEIMAQSPELRNIRFIILLDSLVAIGVIGKGRSPSWPLLRLLRRRSSYSLGARLWTLGVWVDMYHQLFDWRSRFVERI